MPTPLLETVLAQPTAGATLRRALGAGRVHHAYLFEGPDGVGKELAALGLAQALVCERREGKSDACGACSACVRAVPRETAGGGAERPAHPDIVLLERGLYDPAVIGRRTPETQDISIDQVRALVLARAAFGPIEERAKVFIVRRAEELSTPAANALLKTLEEPGKNTHFVLLSSQPDSLLPTIRSRVQRVRFAPLPDEVVAKLLVARGIEAQRATDIAKMARGSVEAATAMADPDESDAREAFVSRALGAIEAEGPGPALELAEEAKKQKDSLGLHLTALASRLADEGRRAAGEESRRAEVFAARYQLVLGALRQLDGNAAPQLVVESMLTRMRRA